MTVQGALIAIGVYAVLIVLWGLDRPSPRSAYTRLRPRFRVATNREGGTDVRGGPRQSRPTPLYDREAWWRDVTERAAEAQLIGQRQDGPIHSPATASSTPDRLTDGRGPNSPRPATPPGQSASAGGLAPGPPVRRDEDPR